MVPRQTNYPKSVVRLLRTEEEYQAALDRLGDLMELDPEPDSEAGEELEILAMFVAQYERRHVPASMPVDPVDAILFALDQLGMTRRDLIPIIGSESRVSEVLNHRRPLTLAMIRRLHAALHIPADLLIQPLSISLKRAS